MKRIGLIGTTDSFGETIRKAREERGWTQDELAQKCDISPMYVSQIERGKRTPRFRILRLLANALDLQERELLRSACRSYIPKEFQDLLEEGQMGRNEGQISDPFRGLFRAADRLPEGKKKWLLKVWRETLQLMADDFSPPTTGH